MNFSTITFGCTFNSGDTLKIENILVNLGYFKSEIIDANLIIINTCAVKQATSSKILFYINKFIEDYPLKKLIITGCLPQMDKKTFGSIAEILKEKGLILHPHNISNIANSVNELFLNEKTKLFSKEINRDKSWLNPIIKPETLNTIIQISEGCDNECSYCCTTHSRGSLVSFDFYQLINQIKTLISNGIKEFFITSQDLGNYYYNGKLLHHLLREISKLKGNFAIRLGMLNPDYLIKHIDDFLEIFSDPRYYRFIHIPIQSASNRILKKMIRNYQKIDIENIVKKIKLYDINFSIATDIICGFPSETNEEHKESLEYIEKLKPNVLNISKFSPRPDTLAQKFKQTNSQIIKKRSREFSKIYKIYTPLIHSNWIGWEGNIFVNKFREEVDFQYMGRNQYYIPIILKSDENILNKTIRVKIINYINHSLIGEKIKKITLKRIEV
jgi:threonylcarbamoyladenosine tRNA methylthiotransferase CDKAL1